MKYIVLFLCVLGWSGAVNLRQDQIRLFNEQNLKVEPDHDRGGFSFCSSVEGPVASGTVATDNLPESDLVSKLGVVFIRGTLLDNTLTNEKCAAILAYFQALRHVEKTTESPKTELQQKIESIRAEKAGYRFYGSGTVGTENVSREWIEKMFKRGANNLASMYYLELICENAQEFPLGFFTLGSCGNGTAGVCVPAILLEPAFWGQKIGNTVVEIMQKMLHVFETFKLYDKNPYALALFDDAQFNGIVSATATLVGESTNLASFKLMARLGALPGYVTKDRFFVFFEKADKTTGVLVDTLIQGVKNNYRELELSSQSGWGECKHNAAAGCLIAMQNGSVKGSFIGCVSKRRVNEIINNLISFNVNESWPPFVRLLEFQKRMQIPAIG